MKTNPIFSILRPLGLAALLASLGSVSAASAAEKKAKGMPVPFPGVTTLVINGGEATVPEQISYDPSLAKLINKPLAAEQGDPEVTRLLSTRLKKDSETRYLIDFDPGPSADPAFVITDEKTQRRIGSMGADALVIPGNGFIYAAGRSNNMHLERQKFEIRDGELVEIKQPFSYVGLDSKALVPLTLTAGKDAGEVIANIPKGDALQVVLRDGEHLLIKTQFGLVGWWKMKTDVMQGNAEIEGIYYAGD